ncbi:MAG: polysaccharide deacetylase family protein, partial [Pseudomonadota bacterium]
MVGFLRLILLQVLFCLTIISTVHAGSDAVILQYHRFGEAEFPNASVSKAQFAAHLDYLLANDYQVMALQELLERIEGGLQVGPKVLAITIDDAFESVYTVAWPMLRQAGLPFTLFVATEAIDKNYAGYMR